MKGLPYHILRFGLAITFLWIGILILQNPEGWSAYIKPWAAELIPVPLKQAMISTAILDIAIGAFLLTNILTGFAALVASLHLAIILVVSGINAITVRDVGLFASALALLMSSWPFQKRFN